MKEDRQESESRSVDSLLRVCLAEKYEIKIKNYTSNCFDYGKSNGLILVRWSFFNKTHVYENV